MVLGDDAGLFGVGLGEGVGSMIDFRLCEEAVLICGVDLGKGVGLSLSAPLELGGALGLDGDLGLGEDTGGRGAVLGFDGGSTGGLGATLGALGCLPGFFATNISVIGLPSGLGRLRGPAASLFWILGRFLSAGVVSGVGLKPLWKVWVSVVGSKASPLTTCFQPNDCNIATRAASTSVLLERSLFASTPFLILPVI
jgi:hypothetical protein